MADNPGAYQGSYFRDFDREVRIDWSRPWAKNHLKSLTLAYARAPYFSSYLPWLNSVYDRRDELLADFTIWLTMEISHMIGITQVKFMRSSDLEGVEGQKTDRLVGILKRVGASHYLSGPAAQAYLDPEKLAAAGISLEYMHYNYAEYPQLHPPYDPFVTILDLMFMTGDQSLSHLTASEPE